MHPSPASLRKALENVVAFEIDGVFHPNSNGNTVVAFDEGDNADEILVSESEAFGVRRIDLLLATIGEDGESLRLADGRKLVLFVEQRARFSAT